MKTFDTEEEYQAWVDSPYMRTPYTCVVKSTGKVHYLDEKDDDLSITLVIKKSGWMKVGTRKMMKHISAITINGDLVDFNEMGGDNDSSYYYRNDYDYYLKAKDDYLYCAQVYSLDQGGYSTYDWKPDSGICLNYLPRRFAMYHPGPIICNKKPGKFDTRRFLHVLAGDIVKIYCKSSYVYSSDGFGLFMRGILEGTDDQPSFGNFTKFAKEIIIGDGFMGELGASLMTDYTKKVFVGKNINAVLTGRHWQRGCQFADNHTKCRMYVRKKTYIEDGYDHERGKIIKI